MRSDLPSGTVTFLFTDVEGSTRLLHELGEESYAEALAEHRRVIRDACATEGGVEVDTQGDAFFFAFPTAPGALAAAGALTERLNEAGPIQVRVGLHTGTPLLGEEGYVGDDVHRAARIAAAGHGGQVLVSSSTEQLVDVELRDLGEHRFKDLAAPERVFQLGEAEFPSLKSLYATNLPVPATAFLGRAQELGEVASLLTADGTRLLTFTGPGGTGKTRLSLQAAAEASDGFPDGLYWVPLAPLRDSSLLETTVAQALEVQEQPGVAIVESIVRSFASRRSLLVLDNCEHLADAVATLLRTLLERCPSLVVAASSRERLGLRSERVYPVPPMAAEDGELLFTERALTVSPDFAPDEHVAAICEAVDRLPLAIELAAARVRSLSTQAIRERLGERLSLLTSRDRDLEERQRTLEATIAWSYDLLDGEEQRVLRALSVFAGGCTLEAAEAVAGADLDVLESLLDKSLIRHRPDEAGQDRYWMLETIREYATARLAEAAEGDARSDAHRAFFVSLAEELGSAPSRPPSAFTRFRADQANLRRALVQSIEVGSAESALRIFGFPGWCWYSIGPVADGYVLVRRALELEGGSTESRAHALRWAAVFATDLGDVGDARSMFDEAESLFAASEDLAGLADVERARSFLETAVGSANEAVAHGERAVELALAAGDEYVLARAQHDLASGLQLAALEVDPPDTAKLNRTLAIFKQALEQDRRLGVEPEHEADRLSSVAFTLTLLGRYAEALAGVQEALRLRTAAATTDPYGPHTVMTLMNAAFVVGGLEHYEQASAALASRALLAFQEHGLMVPAVDLRLLERLEAEARTGLGDDGYDAAVREGEAMTVDQAVELVLSLSTDT